MNSILNTKQLSKNFGGILALSNVNLKIKKNELKSLIGPNGAGKTTLFNVITGRIEPSSGQIYFLGKDITDLPIHQRSKLGICRTFQINSLFLGSTVFENVRIAKQAQKGGSNKIFSQVVDLQDINNETKNILENLGIIEKANQPVNALSYGDQRLLEIGIALAGDPKVLLLDEPVAGMSTVESKRVINLIREIAKNVTVVLVEHDMEVVMSISDSISVLHQGAIIAEGTPKEICNDKVVQKAYLGEEL
jgi:branched-chain amino acid transport system ATP-binding protein